MSNPCAGELKSTIAQTSDTPCLDHALKLHTRYVDLIENWGGLKGEFPGGVARVQLYDIASGVLRASEQYEWGKSDTAYESLPKTKDLQDVLGKDFTAIESEKASFDTHRSGLISELWQVLLSEPLQIELGTKPYPERLQLTARLLSRLDLYENGRELIDKLLTDKPLFSIEQCLDAETYGEVGGEYLDAQNRFRFSTASSSAVTAKVMGASINYLKAVSTTLIGNYAEQGNLNKLTVGIGYLVKRIDPTLGQQLIDNPTAQSLKAAKDALTEADLDSIRNSMGSAVGNVLTFADQLAAIVSLVHLFYDKRGSHTVESMIKVGSDAMNIIAGLTELAHQISKKAVEGGAKLIIRGFSGIANLAGAVLAVLDAKDAWDQGDYSVMSGYALIGAGSAALGVANIAVLLGAKASILGPVGLVVGLVILVGSLIVILTTDHQIQKWFQTSVFGTSWETETDDYSDPEKFRFRWKHGGKVDYARQASDLVSMLRGLSVADSVTVGSSSHLVSFWTGLDIELDIAASTLGISEAERDDYQYSVLEIASPGFEDNTWVYVKRVRKSGDAWQIEPIYAVDVDTGSVHSLHSSTATGPAKARTYPNQTDANSEKLGIWLAAKQFTDVYGLPKNQIDGGIFDDGVWLEFDVAVLPEGTTTAAAKQYANTLESQTVARKRTFLEVS